MVKHLEYKALKLILTALVSSANTDNVSFLTVYLSIFGSLNNSFQAETNQELRK